MRSLRVRLRLTMGVDPSRSESESEMLTTEVGLEVRFPERTAAALLPFGDGLRLRVAVLACPWLDGDGDLLKFMEEPGEEIIDLVAESWNMPSSVLTRSGVGWTPRSLTRDKACVKDGYLFPPVFSLAGLRRRARGSVTVSGPLVTATGTVSATCAN